MESTITFRFFYVNFDDVSNSVSYYFFTNFAFPSESLMFNFFKQKWKVLSSFSSIDDALYYIFSQALNTGHTSDSIIVSFF